MRENRIISNIDMLTPVTPMFQCSSILSWKPKTGNRKVTNFQSFETSNFTRSELKSKHQKSKIQNQESQKPKTNIQKQTIVHRLCKRPNKMMPEQFQNSKTPKPQNSKIAKTATKSKNQKMKKCKKWKNAKNAKNAQKSKVQKWKKWRSLVVASPLLPLRTDTTHSLYENKPFVVASSLPPPFRFCALRCCSSVPNKRRQLGNSIQWNPISGYILYHHSTVHFLFTYTCVFYAKWLFVSPPSAVGRSSQLVVGSQQRQTGAVSKRGRQVEGGRWKVEMWCGDEVVATTTQRSTREGRDFSTWKESSWAATVTAT